MYHRLSFEAGPQFLIRIHGHILPAICSQIGLSLVWIYLKSESRVIYLVEFTGGKPGYECSYGNDISTQFKTSQLVVGSIGSTGHLLCQVVL